MYFVAGRVITPATMDSIGLHLLAKRRNGLVPKATEGVLEASSKSCISAIKCREDFVGKKNIHFDDIYAWRDEGLVFKVKQLMVNNSVLGLDDNRQYMGELGFHFEVYPNDELTVEDLKSALVRLLENCVVYMNKSSLQVDRKSKGHTHRETENQRTEAQNKKEKRAKTKEKKEEKKREKNVTESKRGRKREKRAEEGENQEKGRKRRRANGEGGVDVGGGGDRKGEREREIDGNGGDRGRHGSRGETGSELGSVAVGELDVAELGGGRRGFCRGGAGSGADLSSFAPEEENRWWWSNGH
ncbi:hypothetical protein RJT34_03873 [Clitoria ternatea]|uniref:Uncharacterized protein n=1 Tax=Clitoria ternatea TaxID=43366 RepID=A0AAN9KK77_CLITE